MRALQRHSHLALAAAVLLTSATVAARDTNVDLAVATFRQGVAQYKALDFVAAKQTLQKVDRNKLPSDDKVVLDEYLSKVDLAIRRQAAGMNAYSAAVAALRSDDLVKAKAQFGIAASCEYLPEAVRRDARAQLALVAKKVAAAPPAPTRADMPPTKSTAEAAGQPGTVLDGALERRGKANMLLAEGKQALAADDAPTAIIKFEQALTLVPDLAEARDLLAQAKARAAEPVSPMTVLEQRRRIKRQKTDVEFDTALKRASDLLLTASSTADFEAAAEAARMAENVIQANRSLYDVGEYRDRLAEVARRLDGIQAQRSDWERDQVRKQLDQMAEAEAERVQRVRQQLDQQVIALTENAKTLREEQKYKDALAVVQQILRLQPDHPWAADQERVLQQFILVQEQNDLYQQRSIEEIRAYTDLHEAAIPWYKHLVFPRQWREQAEWNQGKGMPLVGWAEDHRIREVLRQPLATPLDIDVEMSLGEVLQQLGQQMGVNIRVKWRYLENFDYSEEGTKVGPLRLSNVSNEKALRVILEEASGAYANDPNALNYVVDEGELIISTAQDLTRIANMQDVMHVRVYDTRDLLRGWAWADLEFSALGAITGEALDIGGEEGAAIEFEEEEEAAEEPNNRLVDLVRNTIDPSSWDPSGPGRIEVWDDRLVVRQTLANHVAVGDLISQLRRAKEIQVAIEARFIKVSSGYLENINMNLEFYFNFGEDHVSNLDINQQSDIFTNSVSTGTDSIASSITWPAMDVTFSYLDDVEVTFLLEATQAHQDTRTLTAPRITLLSGTQADIYVGESRGYITDWNFELDRGDPNTTADDILSSDPDIGTVNLGSRLQLDVAVSADLKYVTLRIRPSVTSLASTREIPVYGVVNSIIELLNIDVQTLDTTVTIPDGATLLLGGLKSIAEEEREMGVPVLSKIPIINRGFTNRGKVRDDETLLILIKPTVIVPRNDEERQFPSFP